MIDSTREFTEVGLKDMCKACPNLIAINFSGSSQVDDKTIKTILTNSRRIQEIILLRNNKITNDFFGNLSS